MSALNKRVRYTKQGSRYGWCGTIIRISEKHSRFTVDYDNGVEQDYQLSALYEPKDNEQDGYYNGYIKVTSQEPPTNVHKVRKSANLEPMTELPRFTKNSHLVVDLYTGDIISVEANEQDAVAFAHEEASTNPHYRKYVVFKPSLVISAKVPEITTTAIQVVEE